MYSAVYSIPGDNMLGTLKMYLRNFFFLKVSMKQVHFQSNLKKFIVTKIFIAYMKRFYTKALRNDKSYNKELLSVIHVTQFSVKLIFLSGTIYWIMNIMAHILVITLLDLWGFTKFFWLFLQCGGAFLY